MGRFRIGTTLILLLCLSFSGCLSFDEDKRELELVVSYSALNGTVIESYSDGNLISTESVELIFDFSETKSGEKLELFGIEIGDGRSPVEISAQSGSLIPIEFTEHGIYDVIVYAMDDGENQENLTMTIRIDLRIEWIEEETSNPRTLTFDPSPSNGGEHPTMIEIKSTVENPSLIEDVGGGQSVQFTWKITDENGDTCQRNSDKVNDGESVTWNTIHFNTKLIHDLSIDYDEGQDYINVNQSVSIIYKSD